jgi:hypothetical protein
MFEEIEKAHDEEPIPSLPQNHPDVFVSFVWDTTPDATD